MVRALPQGRRIAALTANLGEQTKVPQERGAMGRRRRRPELQAARREARLHRPRPVGIPVPFHVEVPKLTTASGRSVLMSRTALTTASSIAIQLSMSCQVAGRWALAMTMACAPTCRRSATTQWTSAATARTNGP